GCADGALQLQVASRLEYRVDDLRVARTTAQIPRQGLADLGLRRLQGRLQQRLGTHQNAGRAVPALGSPIHAKRDLEWVLHAAVGQSFDGGYFPSLDLDR